MIRRRSIKMRCDVSATGQHAAADGTHVDRYRLSAICHYCRNPIERMRATSAQWFTPKRELLCEICDCEYKVWFAPSELWNEVMRDGHVGGDELWNFVCPTCFTVKADEHGVRYSAFKLSVE